MTETIVVTVVVALVPIVLLVGGIILARFDYAEYRKAMDAKRSPFQRLRSDGSSWSFIDDPDLEDIA